MLTRAQLITFGLLYVSYALSLVIKRNYAFWKDDLVKEGLSDVSTIGSLGALYETLNGISKVAGAVLVDLFPSSMVLSLSLAGQGASCVLFLLPFAALPRGPLPMQVARSVWGLNGFLQAFHWPALSQVFMAWFPVAEERGKWYGVLGTCQNAGAAIAPLVTEYAASLYGWRARLILPGLLAVVYSVALYLALKDAPSSSKTSSGGAAAAAAGPTATAPLKASPAGTTPKKSSAATTKEAHFFSPTTTSSVSSTAPLATQESQQLLQGQGQQQQAPSKGSSAALGPSHTTLPPSPTSPAPRLSVPALIATVLSSRDMWLLAITYFFNSIVRNGTATFVKSLLVGELGHTGATAAWANSGYEIGGGVGGLLCGVLSDGLFGGRRGPIMALFSLALVPLPLALPSLRHAPTHAVVALYFALGFTAFPSHVLNGLLSRELATPGAQATAGGFTKFAGQAGASLADLLTLSVARRYGWNGVAHGLCAAAAASALLHLPLWNAKEGGVVPPSTIHAGVGGGGKKGGKDL
jgi:sugar phosphate permease